MSLPVDVPAELPDMPVALTGSPSPGTPTRGRMQAP